MDRNEIEGTVNKATGRVQDAVGGLTGDAATQVRGKVNQAAGEVQRTYGEAVDSVRDMTRNEPLLALAIAGGIGFVLGALIARR